MLETITTIQAEILPLILAQTNATGPVDNFVANIGPDLWNVIKAILTLVVGLIAAGVIKGIVYKLLQATDIDNRIASWIGGTESRQTEALKIEKWISEVFYWIVIGLTLIAVLSVLNLQAVSNPLNSLLEQIAIFLPKIIGAGLLVLIAWILATITKLVVTRALSGLNIDQTIGRQISDTSTESQLSLSETIGNALYWFIFLLFLPSILSTLQLEGTLTPVRDLLNQILAVIPKILAALLIGAIGWLIAQVVRRLVTNFLAVTGIDRIGAKFGLSARTSNQSLSSIIGTIVYILILIPTAIAALNALEIDAISEPASEMLNQVLTLLPKIFAAAVVLILAYIAAKYISELVTSILTGIGFNNIFTWLGIASPAEVKKQDISQQPTVLQIPEPAQQKTVLQDAAAPVEIPVRTPSELVGIILQVGIMLIASLTAIDILEIEALRNVVAAILVIASRVLVGLIVFAIGLYLANLAFNLIASSGTRQSRILGHTARIAIITLVSAMALQQMGIAPDIVNLAFGLLLGGIAVAIALAFGLGGRDIAAEKIREWLNTFSNQ